MRFYFLLSVLLLFETIIPKARTGVVPGQKQCVLLKGVCKDNGCTSTDDTIGVCNHEKKCCRKWWIFEPYATPVPKAKSP
ncbi:beta-defensin 130B [Trichechus manatus latirostris]|uniref:Beta-defensin 130B n=1 Tax=Trichechus manatus latirostris TaxID=127582 RepID=A0A2Y9RG70_TRIMA|nr:beta-defensin 130B [Trichechus manatus latirostris]